MAKAYGTFNPFQNPDTLPDRPRKRPREKPKLHDWPKDDQLVPGRSYKPPLPESKKKRKHPLIEVLDGN